MNILHHKTAKSHHDFTSRFGLMAPAALLERLGSGKIVDRMMPVPDSNRGYRHGTGRSVWRTSVIFARSGRLSICLVVQRKVVEKSSPPTWDCSTKHRAFRHPVTALDGRIHVVCCVPHDKDKTGMQTTLMVVGLPKTSEHVDSPRACARNQVHGA